MTAPKVNNEDLDNLLDDALNDFKKADANAEGATTDKGVAGTSVASDDSKDDPDAFFLDQANKLAERMNTVFGGMTEGGETTGLPPTQNHDQIMESFKKMAEAAAMTLQGDNQAPDEEVAKYSSSIAQALKGLQEGTDNLAAPISESDVVSMFGGPNFDGSGDGKDDGNMFLPFMEGMMQSLLSAEILLPSIKELLEKYPKYLADNAEKLKPEDKERYEKQFELYKVIEQHLEQEKPDDSAAVKREKFRVVLEDMRKLQEYGQPPDEILAETTNDLPLMDPTMAAEAAAAGPQCPTM